MKNATLVMMMVLGILVALPCASTQAATISVALTTDELGIDGFSGSDYNKDKVADVGVPGEIWMRTTTGEGNILKVTKSGQAGLGTGANPLLVTITAQGHLDVVSGLPTVDHDFYTAGIYLSEDKNAGSLKDEGLGVRAVVVEKVDAPADPGGWTLLRDLDDATGRVRFEGSKDVSGGTDVDIPGVFDAKHDPLDPDAEDLNKAPHVDEIVHFDFNTPDVPVSAKDTAVVLTKFKDDDVVNLHIELLSGEIIDLDYIGIPDDCVQAIDAGDDVWQILFSQIAEIDDTDVLAAFSIRAVDPADVGNLNPADNGPKGTAEHFLIHGFTSETTIPPPPEFPPDDPDPESVPEPSTFLLFGLAGAAVHRRVRSRRRA